VLMKQQRPDIADNCPELLRLMLQRCWDENPKLRPAAVEVAHMLGFLHASLSEYGCDDCSPGAGDCESPSTFAQDLGNMLSRREDSEEGGWTVRRIQKEDHLVVQVSPLSEGTEVSEYSSTSRVPPSLSSIELMPSIVEAVKSAPMLEIAHSTVPPVRRRRPPVELPGDTLAGHLSAMLSRERTTAPQMGMHPEHATRSSERPTSNGHNQDNGHDMVDGKQPTTSKQL